MRIVLIPVNFVPFSIFFLSFLVLIVIILFAPFVCDLRSGGPSPGRFRSTGAGRPTLPLSLRTEIW